MSNDNIVTVIREGRSKIFFSYTNIIQTTHLRFFSITCTKKKSRQIHVLDKIAEKIANKETSIILLTQYYNCRHNKFNIKSINLTWKIQIKLFFHCAVNSNA